MKFNYNYVALLLTCWSSVRADVLPVTVVSPDPTRTSVQTTTPFIYEGEKGCIYKPNEENVCGMYSCRNNHKVMHQITVPLDDGSFHRLMYCCNQHEDLDQEKRECIVNEYKLKLMKHICEMENMTYYPELSACVRALRYTPLDGCEGNNQWIEYNQELNQYICNHKQSLPYYEIGEIPAVLLPGKTIPQKLDLPLCKSLDDCERKDSIRVGDDKIAVRCAPYPVNESEPELCEYFQFIPPSECERPCTVTYTNEEDGYPSFIEKEGFTHSDIDTSYVYSLQFPRNRIGGYEWCVCKSFANTESTTKPITTITTTKTVITYIDYFSSTTKPVNTIPSTKSVKTIPITTTKSLTDIPVPTDSSAKCLPSTVTVTVKEKETVTVQETVTVTITI